MTKLKKEKFLLSFLIILVSFIYGIPHLILSIKFRENYNPLSISGYSPVARDETYAYAPLVNYIWQGHTILRDVYVEEYRNYPTPFLGEVFPSHILAFLSIFTNSIEKTFIVTDFIFPPIIFLLLFYTIKMFVKNNIYSIAIAFFTAIARDFISVIPFPNATYEYLLSVKSQNFLLFLSRSFHPQVTFVFFILSFILLNKLIENPKKIVTIILFGLSFGLLSYSYLFYWTYFLFFYFLVFFYYLFKKDIVILKSLAISGLIFLLISSVYIINMLQFYHLDLAADFVERSSLGNLPFPLTLFRYLLLSLLFLFFFRKKGDKYVLFSFFIVTSFFISFTSKIVIGQDLETLHYLRRTAMPFATLSFFIIIYHYVKSAKKIVIAISTIVLLTGFAFGLRSQIISTNNISQFHQRDKNQQAVLSWLAENVNKESVVGSLDTDLNPLIVTYTNDKIYFPPSDRTITPTSESIIRFSVLCNILGLSIEEQKNLISNKRVFSYMFSYLAYDDKFKLNTNVPIMFQTQTQIENLSKNNWQASLKNFKLDYVVITPQELRSVRPDYKFLDPITSINEYVILRVKKV